MALYASSRAARHAALHAIRQNTQPPARAHPAAEQERGAAPVRPGFALEPRRAECDGGGQPSGEHHDQRVEGRDWDVGASHLNTRPSDQFTSPLPARSPSNPNHRDSWRSNLGVSVQPGARAALGTGSRVVSKCRKTRGRITSRCRRLFEMPRNARNTTIPRRRRLTPSAGPARAADEAGGGGGGGGLPGSWSA